MCQDGNTALDLARQKNQQQMVAYLSQAAGIRERDEKERKEREQSLIVELHRLCEVGDASSVADLLRREDTAAIANISSLPPMQV